MVYALCLHPIVPDRLILAQEEVTKAEGRIWLAHLDLNDLNVEIAVGAHGLKAGVLALPMKALARLATWKQTAHADEGADKKTSEPGFEQLTALAVLFCRYPSAVAHRVERSPVHVVIELHPDPAFADLLCLTSPSGVELQSRTLRTPLRIVNGTGSVVFGVTLVVENGRMLGQARK